MFEFKKATRKGTKLRMAIQGTAGSGKTKTALRIAKGLSPEGKIALVDTEHGSAAKYAGDPVDFDHAEMEPPFHPDRFIAAIDAAASQGYDVLILDSLSHAWFGPGGLLEEVDKIAARMRTSNTFAAWKDATPIQNRLIDAIIRADMHVIATMRSKTEYVLEEQERGGRKVQVPKKVGMAPVQRDGMEYEFDVIGDIDANHRMVITKSRYSAIADDVIEYPGESLGETLREWLDGAEPIGPRMTPKRKAMLEKLAKLNDEAKGLGLDGVDLDSLSHASDAEIESTGKTLAAVVKTRKNEAEIEAQPA